MIKKCMIFYGPLSGGGGGGVDIPQRSFPEEWQGIKQGYKGQENQFKQFANKEPLLKGASDISLAGMKDLSSLTDPLRAKYAGLADTSYLDEIIGSQGALTPEQDRNAQQAALGLSAGAGMANSNAGVAGALLNRDQYRRERLGEAFNERGQDISQRLGLVSGIQGANTAAIAPALATEAGRTGAFSQVTNPILAYLSDLNSSNQNAAAAQSIAGANASAGKTSGTLGAVGSIVGGVATAY
jgi:hypothetical protein